MGKSIKLQGIYLVSRRMFEDMNRLVEAHEVHPVIGRVFPFDRAFTAHYAICAGNGFGKILVQV